MHSVDKLIEILKQEEYKDLMKSMYESAKVSLGDEWKSVDDEVMLTFVRAYCVYLYTKAADDREKELFTISLEMGFAFVGIFETFVDNMNAVSARLAEPINKPRKDELQNLFKYKDSKIYKELSKSNIEIGKMIKNEMGFITIKELKKNRYDSRHRYTITDEEIEAIEKVKKCPYLNQFAHLLYDERGIFNYKCSHKVEKDDDVFKKFLITTNKKNPEYNIIFEDGTIVNYDQGDIRLKPYKYQHLIFLTKLYYAAHYERLKSYYQYLLNEEDSTNYISSRLGYQMLMSSYLNIMRMIETLENVYTKKMIDDSRETFVKIKKIAKYYDL